MLMLTPMLLLILTYTYLGTYIYTLGNMYWDAMRPDENKRDWTKQPKEKTARKWPRHTHTKCRESTDRNHRQSSRIESNQIG